MCSLKDATRVLGEEESLNVTFPNAEVDYTYVATFNQVPGVLVSKEGKECQFRLPHTLRCTIEGEVDEGAQQVSLRAHAVTPTVVAAWWPEAWGAPRLEVGGNILDAPEQVAYGRERFVLVSLPAGKFDIKLSK